jgi:tricorn protease-like protein
VSDGSLGGWLKQHGGKAPSPDAAVEMMDGILAGLNHLHSRRIIHRDLKPENILLQRETPRLADFGIARLLKSSSHSAHVSGTLAYMAPEAFDGKRNEQTDVWSVGVIFYEMLSGRLPYDQQDIPSFIGAIMRHDPPPLPDSVPEVLRTIVMKALQRDPANRYSSVAEMRRDLREAEHQLWLGRRKPEPEAPKPTVPPKPPAKNIAPREPQPTIPFSPAVTEPYVLPVKETLRSETISPAKRIGGKVVLARMAGVAFALAVVVLGGFYLWRFLTDHSRQTLRGHATEVTSVAFSPDGKFIASGSTRSGPTTTLMELWDAQTGESRRAWNGDGGVVYSVAFSPDSKTLASAASDSLTLWDVQTGASKRAWPHTSGSYVRSVAFSPDGRNLLTGEDDKSVKLWDTQTGELKRTFAGHTSWVTTVAFSPDGQTIASGDADDNIKLWDVTTGALKQTLAGHAYIVLSVAFSGDGKRLASGSSDGKIEVWNVPNDGAVKTLSAQSKVKSVAFSPDGATIACGTFLRTVQFWDVATGTLKRALTGHRRAVTSVAFSPDGKTLASGSEDMTVKLWNVP